MNYMRYLIVIEMLDGLLCVWYRGSSSCSHMLPSGLKIATERCTTLVLGRTFCLCLCFMAASGLMTSYFSAQQSLSADETELISLCNDTSTVHRYQ